MQSSCHLAAPVVLLALTITSACSLDPLPAAIELEPGCNPMASTEECLFPFPSSFFEQQDDSSNTGSRWNYNAELLDFPEGSTPFDFTLFNRGDGAPPAVPILLHLGVDIDASQLVDQRHIGDSLDPAAPIMLFEIDGGAQVPILTEMDQNLRASGDHDGRHALVIRPMVPMQMGKRHVVALRNSLRTTGGQPIPSPPAFAALRDGVTTSEPIVEELRDHYDELFSFLETKGLARGDLLLAWDFGVASEDHVIGSILSMRQQAMAQIASAGHDYQITAIEADPNDNTALLVEGDYRVPCFLDANNTVVRDAEGKPQLQAPCMFPFTMVVPAIAKTEAPLALTLFGHGIFGSGRDYMKGGIGTDTLQPLAERGRSVVVATDWIGLSSGDLDLIIGEVISDLNRITIVTDRLQQSLINNLVLVDLVLQELQYDSQVTLGHAQLIAGDQIGYYGVSLGGIQGASLTSISPNIDRAILAVPGGAWSTMLPRSTVFQPIKAFVDLQYPDPLIQIAFISFLQSQFDFSDPINLSTMMYDNPLADAPADRRVLIQEAVGDCQVPNIVTRMLARTIDLAQLQPAADDVYGLPPVNYPTTNAALSQFVMPDRLAEFDPPDDAQVPAQDNGVHSDAILLPGAVDQVIELLANATIDHFCDGVCDPD